MFVSIYLMILARAETCSIHVYVVIYNQASVVLHGETVPCLTAHTKEWLLLKLRHKAL